MKTILGFIIILLTILVVATGGEAVAPLFAFVIMTALFLFGSLFLILLFIALCKFVGQIVSWIFGGGFDWDYIIDIYRLF
jgi:hypothetical protein